jgi:hypothetical protein
LKTVYIKAILGFVYFLVVSGAKTYKDMSGYNAKEERERLLNE